MTITIFTLAQVPPELANAYLQHIRDFDAAHPGCHFEIMADVPDIPLKDIVDMMQLDPALTFTQVFSRKHGGQKK